MDREPLDVAVKRNLLGMADECLDWCGPENGLSMARKSELIELATWLAHTAKTW